MADAVDVLRLVQVSDYVIGTLRTPDRAVPGDGDIPLARIIGQLLEAGYDGVFDIELIGPRIEVEGYQTGRSEGRRAGRVAVGLGRDLTAVAAAGVR